MAIFDEQGTGGSGGLDPKKVGEVGLQGLKHAGIALRALFRVLPFMKVVSLGAKRPVNNAHPAMADVADLGVPAEIGQATGDAAEAR